MKLFGMAKALEAQLDSNEYEPLSFLERLGLLVDNEQTNRENRSLQSRLRKAKLRQTACLEDLDTRSNRGIDRSLLTSLATSKWVQSNQNILIVGPTGVGKSYLACALAQKACRNGFTAMYDRASRLFQELAIAKGDGRYARMLATISRKHVLVIDDFAMTPLTDEQRRDLLEIAEDRYERRSTIITSQVPVENWHDAIGDPTFADAILDRLVHSAYKINLVGDSMRKRRNKPEEGEAK
jgi:DNA replication protein DnaC